MHTTHRVPAFILSLAVTLAMLLAVDRLALTEAAPATLAQAGVAQA